MEENGAEAHPDHLSEEDDNTREGGSGDALKCSYWSSWILCTALPRDQVVFTILTRKSYYVASAILSIFQSYPSPGNPRTKNMTDIMQINVV